MELKTTPSSSSQHWQHYIEFDCLWSISVFPLCIRILNEKSFCYFVFMLLLLCLVCFSSSVSKFIYCWKFILGFWSLWDTYHLIFIWIFCVLCEMVYTQRNVLLDTFRICLSCGSFVLYSFGLKDRIGNGLTEVVQYIEIRIRNRSYKKCHFYLSVSLFVVLLTTEIGGVKGFQICILYNKKDLIELVKQCTSVFSDDWGNM